MTYRPRAAAAAIAAAIAAAQIVSAQLPTSSVFVKAIDSATTAQASASLRNIGQAVHIMTVLIPTATTDVSDFTARLEASYDGTLWVPISADVTTAHAVGSSFAYAMQRAGGVYPYVRARLLQASVKPITIQYTGMQYPLGEITYEDDRYLITPGGGGGGGTGTGGDRATWALCTTGTCAAAVNVTNVWIATAARTLSKCYMYAKIAPTGAALIADVRKNGTSVFSAGNRPQLAAAAHSGSTATFATTALAEGDLLTVDIAQIGSTVTGGYVTLSCSMQ